MMQLVKRMLKEEDGQGMVEYGLIIAGVAIAAIVAIWALGPLISDMFEDINTRMTPAG